MQGKRSIQPMSAFGVALNLLRQRTGIGKPSFVAESLQHQVTQPSAIEPLAELEQMHFTREGNMPGTSPAHARKKRRTDPKIHDATTSSRGRLPDDGVHPVRR